MTLIRKHNHSYLTFNFNLQYNQGTLRFNEMHKGIDGISQKMLTQQLRQLEADGIICRKVYPEVPPRVEYSLSVLGESLKPILEEMNKWGREHLKQKDLTHSDKPVS